MLEGQTLKVNELDVLALIWVPHQPEELLCTGRIRLDLFYALAG